MVSSYFKEWLVAKNLLQHIDHSVRLIQDRTNMIVSCNDFLETPSGMKNEQNGIQEGKICRKKSILRCYLNKMIIFAHVKFI